MPCRTRCSPPWAPGSSEPLQAADIAFAESGQGIALTFTPACDGPCYLAIPDPDEALPADVRVNGTLIGEYFTMDSLGGVMPLGAFAAGEPVSLYLGFAGDAEARAAIQIYSLDGAALSAAVDTLRSGAPEDLAIEEGGRIACTAAATAERDLLVLPFAWEDAGHWQLTVDGRGGPAGTGIRRHDGRAPDRRQPHRAPAIPPPRPAGGSGPYGPVRRGRPALVFAGAPRPAAKGGPPMTDRAMELIVCAGQTLLENGGEVFRAQQTMEIMARSLGVEGFHVYVLTNGIFASARGQDGGQRQPGAPCAADLDPPGAGGGRQRAFPGVGRRQAGPERGAAAAGPGPGAWKRPPPEPNGWPA